MSCNCSCTCQGTWQVPAISLPIDSMTFNGGSDLHCAQSPIPRHQLACNMPSHSRGKRSLESLDEINHLTDFEVWSMISVIAALFIFCLMFAMIALRNHRLVKKLKKGQPRSV